MGGKWLGKALVGFNADVETAKNQIASMLAFAKQTTLNDELQTANDLYAALREKAASLPGETSDYVGMLGMITQPLAKANASMEQMTVFASQGFVLSKALGESWQKSARDIREFINFGKINAVDTFTRTLLNPVGIDATDEGRQKAKGMTQRERMELMFRQLNSPQIKQMADRLSQSFTGRVDAVRDALKQVLGAAGEGLFESMKDTMTAIATFLTANKKAIHAWARVVGGYINKAFLGFQAGLKWLIDHREVLEAILISLGLGFAFVAAKAVIAWLAVAWPIVAGAALIFAIRRLAGEGGLGMIAAVCVAVAAAAIAMWLAVGGPATLAILAIAAFAAVFVMWKDQIVEAVDTVIEKISSMTGYLDKIPFIGQFIHMGRAVSAAVDGDWGEAGWQLFRGANPIANAADTIASSDGIGSVLGNINAPSGTGPSVQVTQGPTTVHIHTPDVAGAKEAFGDVSQQRADAAQRAAFRAGAGNR